jgi:transposase
VFVDESGFLLIAKVVQTWAPVGQTPIHRHVSRRDKISVISGISVSPKRQRLNLYYYLFHENVGREQVVLFVRHLLRHLPGRVIVLLDNSSTHQGEPLEELRKRHRRLRLADFPSYAPDLNPDEGVWRQAKRKLANSCPTDIDELMEDIIRSINGVKRSQKNLQDCIEKSELPAFLRCVITLLIPSPIESSRRLRLHGSLLRPPQK